MTSDRPRYFRDVVAPALQARSILERFGIEFRDQAGEHRTNQCPRCGLRSRPNAVAVNAESGFYHCFVCGGSGDRFDMLARYAGLDVRADFYQVLELAYDITGIEPESGAVDVDKLRRQQREAEAQRKIEREQEAKARHEDAKLRAGAEWRRLATGRYNATSRTTASTYLRTRGLEPRRLVEDDRLRICPNGDLAVALWALDDGELINVVRRVLQPDANAPKVRGLPTCPTSGTLVDRIRDIDKRDTFLVEGVVDALTASHLWPEHTIIGAHGAGRLPLIAGAAAAKVIEKQARLIIIPDTDTTGKAWAEKAIQEATRVGLVIGGNLIILDVGPHADLNAAICAGWRPTIKGLAA